MKALLIMVILNSYSGDNTGLSSQAIHFDTMESCQAAAKSINEYEFTNRKIRSKAYKEAFCVVNDSKAEKVAEAKTKTAVEKAEVKAEETKELAKAETSAE